MLIDEEHRVIDTGQRFADDYGQNLRSEQQLRLLWR